MYLNILENFIGIKCTMIGFNTIFYGTDITENDLKYIGLLVGLHATNNYFDRSDVDYIMKCFKKSFK